MIVNAHKTTLVTVELEKDDIRKILKGQSLYVETRAYNDELVMAHVYCSNPGRITDDIE